MKEEIELTTTIGGSGDDRRDGDDRSGDDDTSGSQGAGSDKHASPSDSNDGDERDATTDDRSVCPLLRNTDGPRESPSPLSFAPSPAHSLPADR